MTSCHHRLSLLVTGVPLIALAISLQSHCNLTAGRWSAPDCIRRPSCRLPQRRHHPNQARPSRAHRTRTRVAADGPSKNRTVGADAGWAGHAHVHACAGGLVRSSERLCRPPSRTQVLHRMLIAAHVTICTGSDCLPSSGSLSPSWRHVTTCCARARRDRSLGSGS